MFFQEEERTILIEKKYVGQTIKLKCKKSKGVKMLPGERKHLRFSWSKDGKVRDLCIYANVCTQNVLRKEKQVRTL